MCVKGVEDQHKCHLSNFATVTDYDAFNLTRGRFIGGLSVLRYFRTVSLWIPVSLVIALMDRLILRYPERYSRGQLRTLQRRVSQWRGVMAKQLVYASAENREINEERPVNLGPVGVNYSGHGR